MLKTVLVIASKKKLQKIKKKKKLKKKKKKLPSSKQSKYPKQISYKMTALALMQNSSLFAIQP